MAFQDGMVLWIMKGLHLENGALHPELTTVPLTCLVLTLVATAFNLPRRASHFILATCEAAFREKEELADEAKISMYAAQKMAFPSLHTALGDSWHALLTTLALMPRGMPSSPHLPWCHVAGTQRRRWHSKAAGRAPPRRVTAQRRR